jgi:hypothetical protein
LSLPRLGEHTPYRVCFLIREGIEKIIPLSSAPPWLKPGNRSGSGNSNHAAACAFGALAGRREGAAAPWRAASHAAVRYAKILRCCCFKVDTTVSMLSTKREPASLCVPKLPLRHSTPGRIARLNSARRSLSPLVFKTVHATFAAHGSSVERSLVMST